MAANKDDSDNETGSPYDDIDLFVAGHSHVGEGDKAD